MSRNTFFAILGSLALLVSACSDDDAVVDPVLTDPRSSFAHLVLSERAFDTDSISVIAGRDKRATDDVSIPLRVAVEGIGTNGARVTDARCTITTEPGGRTITSVALQHAGAGQFTGTVIMNIRRGDVGDYKLLIEGRDDRGQETNTALSSVRVVYGGRPPFFCGLEAPDTLDVPSTGARAFTMIMCVSDSSGSNDIRSVFFNSFRPDGSAATGNPFFMYDDGSNGDAVAGDGRYTFRGSLPAGSMIGIYRFEFQAIDAGNLSSKVYIQRIHVR